jgi:hypothetical protein
MAVGHRKSLHVILHPCVYAASPNSNLHRPSARRRNLAYYEFDSGMVLPEAIAASALLVRGLGRAAAVSGLNGSYRTRLSWNGPHLGRKRT